MAYCGASAATNKSKKLVAQDALDGAAKHQSVLEEELREHRAEIERLKIGRGEMPDHLLCGITLELMKDPVIAADGHTSPQCCSRHWRHEQPYTRDQKCGKMCLQNL